MPGRVEGKVALITGAARGQGRTDAVRLAEEGSDIIIDVRAPVPGAAYDSATPADLEETARQIKKRDRQVITDRLDTRDLAALRTAVDDAVAEFGRLDIVVADAGLCIPAPWDRAASAIFTDTLATT